MSILWFFDLRTFLFDSYCMFPSPSKNCKAYWALNAQLGCLLFLNAFFFLSFSLPKSHWQMKKLWGPQVQIRKGPTFILWRTIPFILAHFGCILVILHAFAAVLCLLWSRFVWFFLFCIWYCCCLSDLGCFTFCCSWFVSNFSSFASLFPCGAFLLMVILWSHFLNTNQHPNVVFVCICLFLRVCICCSFFYWHWIWKIFKYLITPGDSPSPYSHFIFFKDLYSSCHAIKINKNIFICVMVPNLKMGSQCVFKLILLIFFWFTNQ